VHARLTSQRTLLGAAAVGFSLALLRCRGGEGRALTIETQNAPLRSLQWVLRHLGPPLMMALLHRASTDDEGSEPEDENGLYYY
jgi:hypothetical protein